MNKIWDHRHRHRLQDTWRTQGTETGMRINLGKKIQHQPHHQLFSITCVHWVFLDCAVYIFYYRLYNCLQQDLKNLYFSLPVEFLAWHSCQTIITQQKCLKRERKNTKKSHVIAIEGCCISPWMRPRSPCSIRFKLPNERHWILSPWTQSTWLFSHPETEGLNVIARRVLNDSWQSKLIKAVSRWRY